MLSMKLFFVDSLCLCINTRICYISIRELCYLMVVVGAMELEKWGETI